MTVLILCILFLLIGSAFCSSSEAALFSVSKNKLQTLIAQNNKAAKVAMKVKENISSSVGTITILNNIFNIVGSLIAGQLAQPIFPEAWQFGLFSAVLTVLVILFGEIFAKNFGERFATAQILLVSSIIRAISFLFFPILWILDKIVVLVVGERVDSKTSEDEIRVMIEQGALDRGIEKDEHLLINNVFKMNDKTARSIMTPRVNIYGLDAEISLFEQKEDIFNSPHSRLPVYKENHDEILGFILLRDALRLLAEDKADISPEKIVKPILEIKETTRVDSMLIMFQKKRAHIALVVDEFGGTSGLVTLEDVMEELVGEIVDETDEVVDMREVVE